MQKKNIYNHCQQLVQQKIDEIESAMREVQAVANQETKSSVGDKYETGRAMMHLEKEKLASQRAEALRQKKVLDQISLSSSPIVTLGSLVQTNRGWFFVSVGLAKVNLEPEECFAVSPVAPIGQVLIGKAVGEVCTFNGAPLIIISIQ